MLNRLLPQTVRGRLAATFAALTIVVVFGVGIVLIFTTRSQYENALEDQLEAQAQMAASAIATEMAAGEPASTIDAHIKQLGGNIEGRLAIVDGTGRVIANSDGEPAVGP